MQHYLRRLGRRIVPKPWRARARALDDATRTPELARRLDAVERLIARQSEMLLRNGPELLARPGAAGIQRHEFRVYSQGGEDGILLYLLSRIGTRSRAFIEIGIGHGVECNCANLALNFGWRGLMVDGVASHVENAEHFYGSRVPRWERAVRFRAAFVTAENVDALVREGGPTGEIDVFSMDITGNDYWVWKALEAATPRVAVVPYNAAFGPDRAITIPYDPSFVPSEATPYYGGASLLAMTRLADAKGYRLVGCDSAGINAFYVRREDATPELPEVPVAEAFRPCAGWRGSPAEQFRQVEHLPFVTV